MIPLGVMASAGVTHSADPLAAFNWAWRYESDSIVASHGDPVASWPDLSGHGRSATQPNAALQPTFSATAFGGKPGLLFSGDQKLSTAAIAELPQPTTIWFVGGVAPDRYLIDGITPNQRHAIFGSSMFAGSIADLGGIPTTLGVYAARFATSSSRFWGPGFNRGPFSVGSHKLSGLTLGEPFSENGPSSQPLGAVLVINEAQSAADMNTVGNYLAAKYGLTWKEIT